MPAIRIRAANSGDVNPAGDFVVYWMIAQRRTQWNFGLERAVDWAASLRKPLIVLEALRCDYPWASDRLHQFVIQGMADNARSLARKPVHYYPFVERKPGAGRGLLGALARHACLIVSDEYPCFFLPRMVAAAAKNIGVRLEAVDSNGILPLRATEKAFARAVDFRRFLQRTLRSHLAEMPRQDPLARRRLPRLAAFPAEVRARWPPTDEATLSRGNSWLGSLPIDHSVQPSEMVGGAVAAKKRLRAFLDKQLAGYSKVRNQPDADATSHLSPYLHFGHISSHQVFAELAAREAWSPAKLANTASGRSVGWWGMSDSAEAFLDELVTWRELGFNCCRLTANYDQYESLPAWARKTLADHAADPREHVYAMEEFASARTHDPLWNAAQRQLACEGRIHNYLRMLWGKKILHWSKSPQDALHVMIELNNRYGIDGRDPNSYSGIFWVLGRYDRPWGPERAIFGKVRFMSSRNTARKLNVRGYLKRYGENTSSDE